MGYMKELLKKIKSKLIIVKSISIQTTSSISLARNSGAKFCFYLWEILEYNLSIYGFPNM